jgi:hypothetical protein
MCRRLPSIEIPVRALSQIYGSQPPPRQATWHGHRPAKHLSETALSPLPRPQLAFRQDVNLLEDTCQWTRLPSKILPPTSGTVKYVEFLEPWPLLKLWVKYVGRSAEYSLTHSVSANVHRRHERKR